MTRKLATLLVMSLSAAAFAGDLTPPPGPVDSTMKTLDDIEPRIAINDENTPGNATARFVVPGGSYYLTSDIQAGFNQHGIRLSASNVTIDLNGFTIRGDEDSEMPVHGISGSSIGSLTLMNGRIEFFSDAGIVASTNATVRNVKVLDGGGDGMRLGNGATVSGCSVSDRSGMGFVLGDNAVVTESRANSCGDDGIVAGDSSVLTRCVANNNGDEGIAVQASCTLTDCVAESNAGDGITSSSDGTLRGCTSANNTQRGFVLVSGGSATDSTASLNGTVGFDLIQRCVAARCVSRSNGTQGYLCDRAGVFTECISDSNGAQGFVINNFSSIDRCTSLANSGTGIVASSRSAITNNVVDGNGNGNSAITIFAECTVTGNTCIDHPMAPSSGILITGGQNTIDGNTLTDNAFGILANISQNTIVRNTCRSNTTNYDIVAGNDVGTIQTSPVGAGPWDNFDY